jgi:hypothetical protein
MLFEHCEVCQSNGSLHVHDSFEEHSNNDKYIDRKFPRKIHLQYIRMDQNHHYLGYHLRRPLSIEIKI